MRSSLRSDLAAAVRGVALCLAIFAAACSSAATNGTPAAPITAYGPDALTAIQRGPLSFAPATTPLLPPPGTIYFGAYVNFLNTLPPFEAQTGTFEQQLGRPIALHGEYYKWTDNFPSAPELDDYKHGRVPVISWDCGATDHEVATGAQDALLITRAKTLKSYGRLVILRWFWEMNLTYKHESRPKCIDPARDVNGIFLASDYIAAWNHIRSVFAAQGVTNVIWYWCISGDIHNNPNPYYPGPTQVDWIGFDHYDLGGATFFQTMANPYAAIDKIGKPMIVAESAAIPNLQAAFMSSAPSVLQKNYPHILGFMYYDAFGQRADWRLTTSGFAATKTAAATPYFSAMPKYH